MKVQLNLYVILLFYGVAHQLDDTREGGGQLLAQGSRPAKAQCVDPTTLGLISGSDKRSDRLSFIMPHINPRKFSLT